MRLPWQKAQSFLDDTQNQRIAEAIRNAEQRTSGELRIFIEGRCSMVDPVDRAAELFFALKMDKTAERNAVLVYLAVKDRQLAIYGDEGIHLKVGSAFWNREVKLMIEAFHESHYAEGILQCVNDIGEALCTHFPYNSGTDKNELPDEIIFGK